MSIKAYNSASPIADKVLREDGSVISLSGDLISGADPRLAVAFKSMSPLADKLLREDGSIISLSSIFSGGGGGGTGYDGWSPILAIIVNGQRSVLQIHDWIGGSGLKPPVGLYIGENGLESDISYAIDIRGVEGEQGYTPQIIQAPNEATAISLSVSQPQDIFFVEVN